MARKAAGRTTLYWILAAIAVLVLLLIWRKPSTEGFQDLLSLTFPTLIFQTWKSKTEFPDNYKYWKTTWTKYNPTYEYVLYDDDDNKGLIKEKFPWFLNKFEGYKKNIQRADAVRYFFLYVNGGIYADMDFECLKPFDTLLTQNSEYDVLFGAIEYDKDNKFHQDNSVPNAIMISKPRQVFWIFVMHELLHKNGDENERTEAMTGPVLLKKAIDKYNARGDKFREEDWYKEMLEKLGPALAPYPNESKIHIFPPEIFYPISWSTNANDQSRSDGLYSSEREKNSEAMKKKYPNAYAITYWTHNW